MDKLDRLVSQGDGTDRWVLMCLEDRVLTFRQWAGASPETIHYVANLTSHQVHTPEGVWVPPWDVRPDRMYQEVDLLAPGPTPTAFDDSTRQYVERVTCTIGPDRVGVSLEPAASDSLDAFLAAIGG